MKSYMNYYNPAELGERIMILRERVGLSQKRLAQTLGISQAKLSLVETGERSLTLEQLLRVADLFDTDLDYLLTGTATKNTGFAGTGLRNESIEILRDWFTSQDKVTSQRALYALNELISDQKFLKCLGQYLQKDFDQEITAWSDEHEKEITFSAADVTIPSFPFFEIDFDKAARLTLLEYLTLMRDNRIEQAIEESQRKRGRKRSR